MNVYDILPLTFLLDFKSDNMYEQYETFKSVHKLLEQNINSDYQDINKKLFAF